MNFEEIGLSPALLTALHSRGITEPTPVQSGGIPAILSGQNALLQAQTGSGKTLSYLLPLYQRQGETVEKGTQAMILVPTRELAMQVHQEVQWLSKASGIPLQSVTLFGDVNINTQMERLKAKPQIVIGTCDRVLALIQRKKIAMHTVQTFIVDEADKLLDRQSIDSLKAVRKACMRDTQTVLVSATFEGASLLAARAMATDAILVQTETKAEIPAGITHQFLVCERRDKLDNLRRLIRILKPEKALVFINELAEIEFAVEKLRYHDLNCAAIHSESTKAERQRNLSDFKEGKLPFLVATDLAARGLHVDNIPYIFHVNIAEDPTDYLHRSGRTGRNGESGYSISIITSGERPTMGKYRSRFGIKTQEIATRENKVFPVKSKAVK